MNTGSKRGPSLCRHKRSGRAYAKFNGKQVWFGPYDDRATHAEFAAFKARWEASGRQLPEQESKAGPYLVRDLVADYLEHCEVYYRKADGRQTSEVYNSADSMRELVVLYGTTEAESFGLAELKAVRAAMIERPQAVMEHGQDQERKRPPRKRTLARKNINQRVGRIVRAFGWAAEELKIPAATYGALRALRPLKANRSKATEPPKVKPVPWKDVAAILHDVPRSVRGLILFQLCTGCRPGEALQLCLEDIDRRGAVWLYQPKTHKTEHHGKQRIIGIGPRGQRVLRAFMRRVPPPPVDKPLFVSDHGEPYGVRTYRRAIVRACERLDVAPWSPHRLRHNAATKLRREIGIEAARVVLGESSQSVAEIYAEVDHARALQVMAQLG